MEQKAFSRVSSDDITSNLFPESSRSVDVGRLSCKLLTDTPMPKSRTIGKRLFHELSILLIQHVTVTGMATYWKISIACVSIPGSNASLS
jgi:hypothetical protein